MLFRRVFSVRLINPKRFCTASDAIPVVSNVQHEDEDARAEKKIIKVAIIGRPNAGKSTLINQMIGYNVCGISAKVHTTLRKKEAGINLRDTQIVFVDTPGVINSVEAKKYNLGDCLANDIVKQVIRADRIGVIHDAANRWTAKALNETVIEVLKCLPKFKKTFLILNKVDKIAKKTNLLELVRILTTGKDPCELQEEELEFPEKRKKVKEKSWSEFSKIFMVSALTGDGVEDIVTYLRDEAQLGEWEFKRNQKLSQPPQDLIIELLRAYFLEVLPEEVPYRIRYSLELFDVNRLGDISCIVNMTCEKKRIFFRIIRKDKKTQKSYIGEGCKKVEADVSSILGTPVRLRVNIKCKEKLIIPTNS